MSTERLAEGLAKRLDRRKTLARIGAALAGGVGGIFGFTREAGALYYWRCCGLCQPNSGSCSGCACAWCWTCPWDGYYVRCCECHSNTSYCDSSCRNVQCSFAYQIGQSPQP